MKFPQASCTRITTLVVQSSVAEVCTTLVGLPSQLSVRVVVASNAAWLAAITVG